MDDSVAYMDVGKGREQERKLSRHYVYRIASNAIAYAGLLVTKG